ncbi:acetyltransferase [Frondihabitans sucicola]|uniref:Acetyltransferase n=1 Tax=Frondihabitans sucicola TaxID=1268041 RepID=A0ABM8GN99_9MICO|nr:GNAT family N-acetyltransferase [Frondihabitans sucicola]BDZ49708.1 acetyltransferase [Frondihabitans sucicola]
MRSAPARPPIHPLTDGLVALRLRTEFDFDVITTGQRDPQIVRWLSDAPVPDDSPTRSVGRAVNQWSTGRGTPFVIADLQSSVPLGLINLRFETDTEALVAYSVFPDARGRGVAPRALALLTTWAFPTLELTQVTLEADRLNLASIRVAEKTGFRWIRDRRGTVEEGETSVMAVFQLDSEDAAKAAR